MKQTFSQEINTYPGSRPMEKKGPHSRRLLTFDCGCTRQDFLSPPTFTVRLNVIESSDRIETGSQSEGLSSDVESASSRALYSFTLLHASLSFHVFIISVSF